MKNIIIKDFIKTDLAVGSDKGIFIRSEIEKAINHREKVILDFNDIKVITTAFLNQAIGELYGIGNADELNKYIQIEPGNLTNSQKKKIVLVIRNSKRKYSQADIDEVIYHG